MGMCVCVCVCKNSVVNVIISGGCVYTNGIIIVCDLGGNMVSLYVVAYISVSVNCDIEAGV